MGARTEWSFRLVDGLEKVFVDEAPRAMDPSLPWSVFLGETASFQLAYLPPTNSREGLTIQVDADSAPLVTISEVELVPATFLAVEGHDDGYVRDEPGLYPDLLVPLDDGRVRPTFGSWRSVWFDVRVDDPANAGPRTVTVTVTGDSGTTLFEGDVRLTVHPHALPPLDIVNTHWLHVDGIAQYYGVQAFGEEHWRGVEAFIAKAAEMDVTSVLTPTWTPPLDTAVGHYRLATQLIDITENADGYTFGFDKLQRWLEICRRSDVHCLEIAHLFTQWGAKATPAIYVHTDGGLVRKFGWDVPATDPSYRALMEQLLPALRSFLDERWSDGKVLFHISDEPTEANLETYQAAKNVVADLLEGCVVVDALSHYDLVESGAVDLPVVATNAVRPFLDAGQNPLWVYYCVSQNRDVANRFIGMPSLRNRVLGHQLFAFRAAGFLHWGFNFYNAQFSLGQIDPFRDTCSGGGFPAGDPFIVYPGPDGRPLESIRFRVFAQAMADHRALQLLRELTDFDTARALIDQDKTLAFDRFTYDPTHYLTARERVNERILAALAGGSS